MKKIISRTKKQTTLKSEVKLKPLSAARRRPRVKKEGEVRAQFGLFNLKAPRGAHKRRKLLGRGSSSGHGKTSTRGSKGQTSRAGRDFYAGFEGGQSPLIRKIPKRGFSSLAKKEYQIVNLETLSEIKETTISPQLLQDKGLIKDKDKLVKILAKGKIKNPLVIQAHAFSKKAAQEIVNRGGKAELLSHV